MNRWWQWTLVTVFALVLSGRGATWGQLQTAVPSGNYPPPQYYFLFPNYNDGEYRDVYREFAAASGAFRTGTDRFVDSCCYWTMAGECQFHTGGYLEALNFYEQSLKLYLSHLAQNWQNRVVPVRPSNALTNAWQRTQITWGETKRSFQIPSLPDRMQVLFGEFNSAEKVLTVGGNFDPARFQAMDVTEVLRTQAIALHRRRWLKGPLCRFDPFTSRLVKRLGAQSQNDGTVLGAYNGVLYGIALASQEDYDGAKRVLQNSLQFGGVFDHALTPIALLELAQINHTQGDTNTASYLALEASFSAAIFNQFDVLEEALSLGAAIHMETKQPGVYPPLQPAVVWSARNRARLPQVSLALRLAECFCEAGDAASAANLLSDASRSFSNRTGFGTGNLSGRAGYLLAESYFLNGNFEEGLSQLQKAIGEFAKASRWLFQLNLAERAVLSGTIADRHAQTLYSLLLRDPTEREWRADPIEAVTFLASPHLPAIDRWLQLTLNERNYRQALHVQELFRRHRFFAELPLGGRELAFRWVMHAPAEALTQVAESQRVDFFARYPAYKAISDQAESLRMDLLRQPLQSPAGSEEQKLQIGKFVDLMKVCQTQDALLMSIALRREPAEMLFPPQIPVADILKSLAPHQTVLYVLETAGQIYVLEATTSGVRLLAQHTVRDFGIALNQLFKDTKLESKELTLEELEARDWIPKVQEFTAKFCPGLSLYTKGELPAELIVIPGGPSWYLPMELLCWDQAGQPEYLWQRARIRYSPTLGLAVVPQRPVTQWKRAAFFPGRLSDVADAEWVGQQFQSLLADFPQLAYFPERMDAPSAWFGAVCDEFFVWNEMGKFPSEGPFALTVVQKDRGRNGSRLNQWLTLPWNGAEHVVLPFFESEGARGWRGKSNGDDLFLTSLALIATGARTVVLSRWPTQGKSGLDFSQFYFRNSRTGSAVDAMHAARLAMQTQAIGFDREQRVSKPKTPRGIEGQHPLFWSGYMLFDVPTSANPQQQMMAVVNTEQMLKDATADALALPAIDPAAAGNGDMDDQVIQDPAAMTVDPPPAEEKKSNKKSSGKEKKKKADKDDD